MPLESSNLAETDVDESSRRSLTVIAGSMADVVARAGGWLCDRARAGWDVNVRVADRGDGRPLAILGAAPLDADAGTILDSTRRDGEVAVSAALLRTDARIRDEVLGLLKRGVTEVTVWGDDWPAELGRAVAPVEHRVSAAARAFKAHAMRAADVPHNAVAPTETLYALGARAVRPLYSV